MVSRKRWISILGLVLINLILLLIFTYQRNKSVETQRNINLAENILASPSGPFSVLSKRDTTIIDKINKIAASQGVAAAWSYFKKNYSNFDNGNHNIAHYIGRLLYQQKGLDAISICDDSFGFGCYHGLVEELIWTGGIGKVKDLISKCKSLPIYSGRLTCYHGIGHGILPYYKYSLAKALSYCDEALTNEFRPSCYTGVFMENANYISANKNDLLWPCTEVADKYKVSCFQYQQQTIFAGVKDLKSAFDVCKNAGKDVYVMYCIRSIGGIYIGQRTTDPAKVVESCNLAGEEYSHDCVTAAAEDWTTYKVPIEKINALCNGISSKWSRDCLAHVNVQISFR